MAMTHTHGSPWKFAAGWVHVSHLWQSIFEMFSPRDATLAILMSVSSQSPAGESRGLCVVPSQVNCSEVSTPSGQLSWQHGAQAPRQAQGDAQWLSHGRCRSRIRKPSWIWRDTLPLDISSLCCQHVPLIPVFLLVKFHLLFSWVTIHLTVSWDIWLRSCHSYTELGSVGANRVQRESAAQGWRKPELCLEWKHWEL